MISDKLLAERNPMEAAKVIEEHEVNSQAVTALTNRSILRGSIDDITSLLVEIEEFHY